MTDALEQVLRLVAEGRLTAAQAGPILDALAADDGGDATPPVRPADPTPTPVGNEGPGTRPATSIRIEVTDNGRKTINLRVPVSLGRMALDRIPGLSGTNVDLVRQALAEGRSGTLLDIDDDGSGVRIALE
jgi:hypothetical protein